MTSDEPEPPGFDPAEVEQLVRLLIDLGAGEDEARSAVASLQAGPLALELSLRESEPVPFGAAADRLGMAEPDLARLWHGLGLSLPPNGQVSGDVVEALAAVRAGVAPWLGVESTQALLRLLGSTTTHIAEALVDAFRVQIEVPTLLAGTSYVDVVKASLALTDAALPGFEALVAAVVRAHLVRVSAGAWSVDAGLAATRRDLFVGFVDLSGYTAIASTASPTELATMLARFEDITADVVTTGGGRVVKLIGDGAMFVAESPTDGCRVSLHLCERLAAEPSLPPARVGADFGSVLSRSGDYYGDVVNRAARLVAVARPGTVVVSEPVHTAAGEGLAFEPLPAQPLKGFDTPAASFRLR